MSYENRYRYREEDRLWALAVALAVALAALVFTVVYVKAEEPAEADLRREAEWLALRADRFDKETLAADEEATLIAMVMLRKARRYPEVADVSVLPVVRDSAIAMNVASGSMGVEIPPELFSLAERWGASVLVQYGERVGDAGIVWLHFFRLLHTPSLIAEFQKIKGVANVRDIADPPPPGFNAVTIEYKSSEPPLMPVFLKIRRVAGETAVERAWVTYTMTCILDTRVGLLGELKIANTEYSTEKK